MGAEKQRWLGLGLGLVTGAVLTATQFPAAGNDDSHITYWAAHALAQHGAVLNYNGAPVEQSSSLALVLILGAIHALTSLPIPATAWVFGIACGIATVVVATALARQIDARTAPWVPALVATALPFAYWSTSGMETALTALLGYAVVHELGTALDTRRRPFGARGIATVALMAGFALARPETPLILACLLAGITALHAFTWLQRRDAVARSELAASALHLALGLGVIAAVVALRFALFHAFVPNSAAAKVGGFELSAGARYLWRGLTKTNLLLAAAALAGAVGLGRETLAGRGSACVPLLLGFTLAYASFILGSGGDWMPAARLLAPLCPALGILAGILALRASTLHRFAPAAIATALVLLNLGSALKFGGSRENGSFTGRVASDGEGALLASAANPHFAFTELGNRAHRRDARLLGALLPALEQLHPTAEHPLYVMSGQAGMVPYYAFQSHFGALKLIDLFAITTRDILACMPSNKLNAGIHGVRVDPIYVIEHADEMPASCGARRPAIVFSTGRFPKNLSEHGYRKLYEGPKELEAYVAIDARLGE